MACLERFSAVAFQGRERKEGTAFHQPFETEPKCHQEGICDWCSYTYDSPLRSLCPQFDDFFPFVCLFLLILVCKIPYKWFSRTRSEKVMPCSWGGGSCFPCAPM